MIRAPRAACASSLGRQSGSSVLTDPPPMNDKGPRHGEWDGEQHIGGNQFAGGSGGTGTAGLGGRAGPYRLDVGQDVHMLSEEQKRAQRALLACVLNECWRSFVWHVYAFLAP